MTRTRNTNKIQKRLKEEERQAIAAAGTQKAAEEEKAAAEEEIAAEEKKAADEKTESAEEEETAIEEEKEAEEEKEEEESEQEEETAQMDSDAESACGDHRSDGSVSSRKRLASESSDELHYVPALKKQHKAWANFEAYLKVYEKRTSTVLVITETLNVRLRNERMKKQKRYLNKPDSEINLVPEDMDPFQRIYISLTVGNNDCAQWGAARSARDVYYLQGSVRRSSLRTYGREVVDRD